MCDNNNCLMRRLCKAGQNCHGVDDDQKIKCFNQVLDTSLTMKQLRAIHFQRIRDMNPERIQMMFRMIQESDWNWADPCFKISEFFIFRPTSGA